MALSLDLRPEHESVLVTAHLRTGIGYDPPYGLDLAGILASRVRAVDKDQRHAAGQLLSNPLPDTTEEEPEDLGLPLGRCITGDDWHWTASCAIPVSPAPDPDPRTFYRVSDARYAHSAATRPLPYTHPSKGPHRDIMMAAPVTMCTAVQWHAIGDRARIEQLVRGIMFMGRRRSVGEGRVLSWSVVAVEENRLGGWSHVHDGNIVRPCPEQCAQELGIPYRLGTYEIRPPSWHPDRLQHLAMTEEPEEEW